jgi:hypothetical protein
MTLRLYLCNRSIVQPDCLGLSWSNTSQIKKHNSKRGGRQVHPHDKHRNRCVLTRPVNFNYKPESDSMVR